jgi:hypothetical protein
MHIGAVGVEDPGDLDAQIILSAVIEEQSLRRALALVLAGAWSERIDVAPITLGLRVDLGIAVISLVLAWRMRAPTRLASPSMLIAPTTLVLVVWTGSN